MFRQRNAWLLSAALTLMATAACADGEHYATKLDPVAFDNSTVKNTVGSGTATATLAGHVLTISGAYAGLSSPAIDAHVKMGLAMGVPGPVIGDLQVSGGVSGQITGSLTLTAAQLAALKQGALSVVIDSARAPQGNLWGWLHLPTA